MFCKHCGNQVADDAVFCSHCGTRLLEDVPPAPAIEQTETVQAVAQETQAGTEQPAVAAAAPETVQPAQTAENEVPAKPFLEEMSWNVSEYPDSNTVEKTEDINFDWGLDPEEVSATMQEEPAPAPAPQVKTPETEDTAKQRVAEVFDRVVPEEEAKASIPVKEALEAAGKVESVGQFNTFNKKNAEFQQLLDKEYEKVRRAGTIANEQEAAEEAASRKFESRQEDMTMDDFLQKEGVVKRYEPKEVESDVLDRIKAQDAQRAQKQAEEEARIKALEEARAQAAAKMKAEEEARNQQLEAAAAAEAEIRAAEQAEALRIQEEEARKKAEEDAAKLEAIARRKAEEEARAQEEARLKAAEEARAKAEAEARARAQEEARAKAEEAAKAQAEEAARIKAEEDLKAAQEAARIRAQQEAAMAAREEAEFKAAQERQKRQEEISRLKREAEEKQRARAEDSVAVENEVRKAFEQTAKMRQEEEEKIKAALAGIRGGRFSDTLSATEKAEPEAEKPEAEIIEPVEQVVEPETDTAAPEEERSSRGTILAERDKIEEAHRHTRYNIEGMAKAREDFFADLPGGDPEAERKAEKESKAEEAAEPAKEQKPYTELLSPETRNVDKEAIAAGLSSTRKLSREEVGISDASAGKPEINSAADLLSQFAKVGGTKIEEAEERAEIPQAEAPKPEVSIPAVEPAEIDAPQVEVPQPQAPQMERPQADAPEVEIPQEKAPEVETPQIQTPEAEETPVEEMILETPGSEEPAAQEPQEETGYGEGFFELEDVKEETDDPALAALMAEKPGLEDTMVMPEINHLDELTTKDIDGYERADELKALRDAAADQQAREAEEAAAAAAERKAAEELAAAPSHETARQIASEMAGMVSTDGQMQAADAGADRIDGASEIAAGIAAVEASLTGEQPQAAAAQAATEEQLSPKELKKLERAKAKEAKRLAKEKKKEEKQKIKEDTFGQEEAGIVTEEDTEVKKGGKGRLILMIILILLCVIFAFELVGIGIKMFASTSPAAEFIDNILNNIIHMITGESDGGTGSV